MSYSECDRFLVSLYYAYGCALLKKGSSEVRTCPVAMEYTHTPQVVLSQPHLSSPCPLFFLSSWPLSIILLPSSLPYSPVLLPSILSSPVLFPSPPHLFFLVLSFLLSFPPSLLSFPSLLLPQSAESALDQFETIISEYQSSMTFPPAHYGSARAYIQLHR